jgi:hypothetical protein
MGVDFAPWGERRGSTRVCGGFVSVLKGVPREKTEIRQRCGVRGLGFYTENLT